MVTIHALHLHIFAAVGDGSYYGTDIDTEYLIGCFRSKPSKETISEACVSNFTKINKFLVTQPWNPVHFDVSDETTKYFLEEHGLSYKNVMYTLVCREVELAP